MLDDARHTQVVGPPTRRQGALNRGRRWASRTEPSHTQVGYYSICSLPRGDLFGFIWDLYDPRRTGEIDSEAFRCMIREACLPCSLTI